MKTLVHINRKSFSNLKDEELVHNVFPKDLFSRIRGKHPSYKKQVISTLTQGQQALFAFMTIYYHNVLGWRSFVEAFSFEIANGFLKTLQTTNKGLNIGNTSSLYKMLAAMGHKTEDSREDIEEIRKYKCKKP